MSPTRYGSDPASARERDLRRRRFGQRLRSVREDAGLTQEALANLSGVSRTMLVDIEAGRRGVLLDRLWDLSRALDIRPGDLVDELG